MGWAKYMEDNMDAISERLAEKDITRPTVPRHTVTEVKRQCLQSVGDSFPKATKKPTNIIRSKRVSGDISGVYRIIPYNNAPLRKQHKYKPACIVPPWGCGWACAFIPVRVDQKKRIIYILRDVYNRERVNMMDSLEIRGCKTA